MKLGHLIAHYGVVGGDKKVVREAEMLRENLLDPLDFLDCALKVSPNGM